MQTPFFASSIFCFLLLGLAVMDGETMRLPDAFTLSGTGLAVIFAAFYPQGWIQSAQAHPALRAACYSFSSALAAAGVVLIVRLLYQAFRGQEGIGLGDAKLFAMIAAWLGMERALLVFFLAVVSGAAVAVAMLLSKRRGDTPWREDRLPFGMFLALAAIYAQFSGWSTIRWYVRLF